MPLTPEIWKNRFTVNTVTEGAQFDPVITQLANGNVLVVWTSDADVGVGSAAGSDVIGQILDPLGNPVGNEIRLNQFFAADDEARPAITALPNGGFVVAYQDRDANDKISLRLNEFNENGGHVSDSQTISGGTGGGDSVYEQHWELLIAAASNTSVLIAYEGSENGTDDGVFYKIYNPTANSYSSEITISSRADLSDVSVLNDGRYAVTTVDRHGIFSDRLVEVKIDIINSDGSPAFGLDIARNDNDIDGPSSLTALADGGFVVVWDRSRSDIFDEDVMFQRFSADGAVLGTSTVNGTGLGDRHDVSQPDLGSA